MKNSKIAATFINLNEIMNKEEKYPVKFSYALSKNLIAIEPLNKAYTEARDHLLDRYNRKDDDGKPAYKITGKIEIAEEYQAVWQKEFQELLDIEVECTPHMISVEDLPEGIEPAILYALDFMIKE